MTRPPFEGEWRTGALQGFAAHNGPIWQDPAAGRLALQIQPARTNITGRFHGGMAMSLQSLAFAQAAGQAARKAQPQAGAALLTLHCELIDSAVVGDWVAAATRVERVTRTLVFLTGGMACGERKLMTASAVFQIGEAATQPDLRNAVAEVRPSGYHVLDPVDAFCAHVGPIYERYDENKERFGGFHVSPRHLDADGGDAVDTGMLMMLADLYLGRRARIAAGGVCVTLGMTLSQVAPMRLGDLVEIDSRLEGQTSEVVIVTGSFRVAGRLVMSATSSWKKVHPR